LDGEIQKSNVIFMATTNHIDKIPARIRRPGRFSSIIEVGFPSEETRLFYLNKKLGGRSGLGLWAKKTEGFSIDELKETVLAVVCLSQDLDAVIKRVKANKDSIDYADQEKEDDDNEENTFNIMTSNKRNGRR
jgi:SpoVK/Ycf46/Vps4 family AAA+-type ATPase